MTPLRKHLGQAANVAVQTVWYGCVAVALGFIAHVFWKAFLLGWQVAS